MANPISPLNTYQILDAQARQILAQAKSSQSFLNDIGDFFAGSDNKWRALESTIEKAVAEAAGGKLDAAISHLKSAIAEVGYVANLPSVGDYLKEEVQKDIGLIGDKLTSSWSTLQYIGIGIVIVAVAATVIVVSKR